MHKHTPGHPTTGQLLTPRSVTRALWRRAPRAFRARVWPLCRGDGSHVRGDRAAGEGSSCTLPRQRAIATGFLPENCLRCPTARVKGTGADRAFSQRRAVSRWEGAQADYRLITQRSSVTQKAYARNGS
jgi:hypothetical protein